LRSRPLIRQWSPEAFQRALSCLEQAVALDPEYAAAHAAIADMLGAALRFGLVPAATVLDRLTQAAETALSLDPTCPEAHLALSATSAIVRHDWTQSERRALRAIEERPGDASAHIWHAYLALLPFRKFDEADRHLRRAIQLDPIGPFANASYANLRCW